MTKAVVQHMGFVEKTFHLCMIICTVGMWAPIYIRRKRQLERTTIFS